MKDTELNKFNMKKDIVKDIINEGSQLESSKGKELKVLLEQILSDQDTTEGLDEFQDQDDDSESWQTEDDAAEGDDFADFADEPAEDEPAEEGTVTIEFTKDEVELLRSILSKVDAGDDDVEVEDDMDDEEIEDDTEADDADETEDDEVEDDMMEEDEEVEVAKGSPSQFAKTFDSAAPSRKKQTPAVNRKYEADAPDINRDRANGEGDAALGNGAPSRKKQTPAVNRQGHVTNTRIKPGKDIFHIGK